MSDTPNVAVKAEAVSSHYTASGELALAGALSRAFDSRTMTVLVQDRIVEKLAEQFVAEHGQKILASVDPRAAALVLLGRGAEELLKVLKR